jgi:Reverse transcriptase (RNA-dependent DNA polymerase)
MLLAKRLQSHMGKFLIESQTGFVKGRNIFHGFYYAQEVIKAATKHKQQITVFKADIHKTFDSIVWPFILKCLSASGFPEKLINWI